MLILQNCCFNAAHWIFAFKYFKIQKVMPIFRSGQTVPEETKKDLDRTNTIFTAINLAAPLLGGVAFYFLNIDQLEQRPENAAYLAASWSYVSGKFLVCFV